MSRTREALVDGVVSPEQADVIVAAVADLPAREWTRRRGEKLMLRHATTLNATELAKAGRHLVEVVDPDAADRTLEAALEREERAAHLDRPSRSSPTAPVGSGSGAAGPPRTAPSSKQRSSP